MGHRGMTRGDDGICLLHVCVYMFQERDILKESGWEKRVSQVRYSGKRETQNLPVQLSTCYCFGFLLCKTGIILTKET